MAQAFVIISAVPAGAHLTAMRRDSACFGADTAMRRHQGVTAERYTMINTLRDIH